MSCLRLARSSGRGGGVCRVRQGPGPKRRVRLAWLISLLPFPVSLPHGVATSDAPYKKTPPGKSGPMAPLGPALDAQKNLRGGEKAANCDDRRSGVLCSSCVSRALEGVEEEAGLRVGLVRLGESKGPIKIPAAAPAPAPAPKHQLVRPTLLLKQGRERERERAKIGSPLPPTDHAGLAAGKGVAKVVRAFWKLQEAACNKG